LGSTVFIISREATKAFRISVVQRSIPQLSSDVGGKSILTEGLYTVPLGLSFGSYRTYDVKNHSFEVMKTLSKYDAVIPVWYLEKYPAEGTTAEQLHFPHC
jgi:hypothetical protein